LALLDEDETTEEKRRRGSAAMKTEEKTGEPVRAVDGDTPAENEDERVGLTNGDGTDQLKRRRTSL
jgi:hypothetical protein